jgi:teichuronic acid biosynthesis glycosyltransferase TuaH
MRSDLVVYFASTRYDGPAGTDRHMADALSGHAPVLFVEPPISVLTPLRNRELTSLSAQPSLQVVSARLARLTPWVVPGANRPGIHRLVAPMMRRAVRDSVRRLYAAAEAPVAAVVSCQVHNLWSAVASRRKLFYSTDDLPAGADLLGLPRARLVRNEFRTLKGADAVAAVSVPLQERYVRSGFAAELLPNGCRPEVYAGVETAPPPTDVRLCGPAAGFVGYVNNRIDLALLEAVADAGCSLLIVGPCAPGYQPERFLALAERPNVCWVGPKPFAELPSYLRLIDVGLTPYADTEFNRASFPLKTLEYLAAGRAVVATPLPANDWLATDLIEVAAGPTEFARRVLTSLAIPRTPALAAQRRAFAAEHSWQRRAARLAALLRIEGGRQEPTTGPYPTDRLEDRKL